MEKLMLEARKYEDELNKFTRQSNFLHDLQLGIALAGMTAKMPCLKPDFIEAAGRLRVVFNLMRQDIKRAGAIRCWQFKRRRYRRFALKIAQLSGRLKQAAGRLGG